MKENKIFKVQVRITPKEKALLKKLREIDEDITASRLFREALKKSCEQHNITDENKVGNFTIG